MAVFRYSPAAIASLTHRIRRRHITIFLVITILLCSLGLGLSPIAARIVFVVAVASLMIGLLIRGDQKARERIASLLGSNEFEIDEESAVHRSSLGKTILSRSEITDAWLASNGVWLRGRSRRVLFSIPAEVQDFDKVVEILPEWLPESVVRHSFAPSRRWAKVRIYGQSIAVLFVVYAALVSQRSVIVVPASILSAIWAVWYFTWCGRKVAEQKYKVLLALSGYLLAAALLLRPITLLLQH